MKHKLTCETCGTHFEHSIKIKKTCSNECHRKRVYKLNGYSSSGLPNNFLGKLHEMKVQIDLGERGYDVYCAVFPQQYYDLMILSRSSGDIKRVEVKTGYRSGVSKKVIMPKHSHDDWDILAVAIRSTNEIVYFGKSGEIIEP